GGRRTYAGLPYYRFPARHRTRRGLTRSELREKVALLERRADAEVVVGAGRGDAPARRPGHEAFLDQVRLVDLLDRAGVLAHGHGDGRDADGAALELLHQREQDAAVHLVEAGLVHVERVQGVVGEGARDAAVALDLGEVARAAEEAVGDARRAAAAPGDLVRAVLLDLDADDARRAEDDLLKELGGVVVVAEVDPEAGAERGREEALARRRADERERRQRDADGARARAGIDQDVDGVVLHRGVEVLLDDRAHPVDLVDEEDVAFVEVRQDAGDARGLVERGPARGLDGGAHLLGDDVGEGGLAEAGRAGEHDVVERLAALEGGGEEDAEVVLDLLLPDELVERLGAELLLEVLLGALRLGGDEVAVFHRRAERRRDGATYAAPLTAPRHRAVQPGPSSPDRPALINDGPHPI